VIILLGAGWAMFGADWQEDSLSNAGISLERRIEQAAPSSRFGIVNQALGCVEVWPEDPQRYADSVNTAFMTLWKYGVSNRTEAQQLEQKCVLSALGNADRISAATELRLAVRLQANVFSASPSDSEETRSKLASVFHAWRRMEQETKSDFNFADRPTENVSPPRKGFERGEVRFAGMDPAYVKDPSTRAEYEAAIEKNQAKAAEYNRQSALRNMKEPFIRHAEGFILSAIRSGAVTEAEVSSNLNLVQDDKARERVLAKVIALRH